MKKTSLLILSVAMAAAAGANGQIIATQIAVSTAEFSPQSADAPAWRTVAQVKDDLFAGTEKFAKGATDVTEINLDPKMMGLIPGNKGNDSGLARKLRFMVIHTYSYDKPGMYRMEDVEEYRKKLEDGSWICAVHVRDKDGTTDICGRTSSDHETSEMVILAAEPKELTFIHMSGNMSLEDLQKMGNATGATKSKGKEKDMDKMP